MTSIPTKPLDHPEAPGESEDRHPGTNDDRSDHLPRGHDGDAQNVYRFTPFKYEKDWMARAHGVDERIAVAALIDGVRFYAALVRNTDSMPA